MITREMLKELAASTSDNLFLSVHLGTSSLDDWRQTVPTFVNSEYNRVTRNNSLPKDTRRFLEEDFKRVRNALDYDLSRRTAGLSIFADGAAGQFERIELPCRLTNRVVAEPSPYIRPLLHVLSLLEPFVVVRVSRDGSSIYVVDEWQIAREDDFSGPYLKSTDRETGDVPIKEYYAADRQDALVDQHFKEVATALDKIVRKAGTRRVVVSGQHEIVSNFRKNLKPESEKRVAAEISWDPTLTDGQLVDSAREALTQARQQEKAELAAAIAEGLGAGGLGVSGFSDTAMALHRGQVRTLLVDRGFRPAGWRCLECDYVDLSEVETCPVCKSAVAAVHDAVNDAIRMAILQGTLVEVAEDIPALSELGGIAGLLRYP